MSDAKNGGAEKGSKKTIRSPKYPAIPLAEAVEKAKTFFGHEKYSDAPCGVALGHWDYKSNSGSGLRILSALIQFGLMEDEGSGSKRRVKLTELGRALVLDERDGPERRNALKRAALSPSIYSELWKAHPKGLPSDENLRHELIMNRKFNPDSVETFIRDFRATLRLANLSETGSMSDEESDIDGPDDPVRPSESPRREAKRMPDTQLPDARPWDLTIPLIGGGQAILRAPIPLSEENYALLTTMLESTLKSMKKAITKPTVEDAEDDT